MKNKDQDTSIYNPDLKLKKNLNSDTIKTTNINILLNRVKLDRKKENKKKFFLFLIFLTTIFSFSFFVIN